MGGAEIKKSERQLQLPQRCATDNPQAKGPEIPVAYLQQRPPVQRDLHLLHDFHVHSTLLVDGPVRCIAAGFMRLITRLPRTS